MFGQKRGHFGGCWDRVEKGPWGRGWNGADSGLVWAGKVGCGRGSGTVWRRGFPDGLGPGDEEVMSGGVVVEKMEGG